MTETPSEAGPAPDMTAMSTHELTTLARAGGPYRGKAVFALIDRIPLDVVAVESLGELARLPQLHRDRIHLVTLAWAVITALLAAQTARSRELAHRAFQDLPESEQKDLLGWWKADSFEQARPARP